MVPETPTKMGTMWMLLALLLSPLLTARCEGRLACGPFPSLTHAQEHGSFFLSFLRRPWWPEFETLNLL